jgi:hypothetical protein
MARRLDDAAAASGRDPARIRRILNVNGIITDGATHGMLQGPVNQWVDELTYLAITYGFDTFIFWGEGDGQLQRFAGQVVPAVRTQVAAERAQDRAGEQGQKLKTAWRRLCSRR